MPKSDSPLYAAYVQATRVAEDTGKTMRRQWIVFPPLPPTATDVARHQFLMFHREQVTPENRSKWLYSFVDPDLLPRDLGEKINALQRANASWRISPVITVQVTPYELRELIKEPRTPYRVLTRFEKIARQRHHLAI